VRLLNPSTTSRFQSEAEVSSSSEESSQQAIPAVSGALAPGMLIGGIYRVNRLVGVGGMGEVWEARHERTKGRVALKLLLLEMGHHQEVLFRFQREVEITSALNHPNIVRVSDADNTTGKASANASTHDHPVSPRRPKSVTGKPRPHPGPLNDNL